MVFFCLFVCLLFCFWLVVLGWWGVGGIVCLLVCLLVRSFLCFQSLVGLDNEQRGTIPGSPALEWDA